MSGSSECLSMGLPAHMQNGLKTTFETLNVRKFQKEIAVPLILTKNNDEFPPNFQTPKNREVEMLLQKRILLLNYEQPVFSKMDQANP